MNNHRYTLEPYNGMKSRYHCPNCQNRQKTFSRYIDTETGNYIADHVGRCNREEKCGYHYTPKQYFIDNNIECVPKYAGAYPVRGVRRGTQNTYSTQSTQNTYSTQSTRETPPTFIDIETFEKSLSNYDNNVFIQYLIRSLGDEHTARIIEKYKIGTSERKWKGATVFYQIDTNGKIRRGKIMLYDNSGHRVKNPFPHITSVHTMINKANRKPAECLFGEHLVPGNDLPIAIVESEKTACIASIYLPQFLWLACGQLRGLNAEKCKVLEGKTVFLFPDLGAYNDWEVKAKELQAKLPGTRFIVSDYLEKNAPEADKAEGYDIADYLIKFDVKDFTQSTPDYPESWNDCTPDFSDKWQLINHLVNKGKSLEAATKFANNDPVRQLISAGFDQIEVCNLKNRSYEKCV